MSAKIVELMQVPAEAHDLNWLQQMLQAAIELELSTLPPYLCGLWSVQDQNDPVAQLILSVAFQEMVHMGLACNMLTAIGGTPQITNNVPAYPGPLPGGVRPELTVYLSGLSQDYVNNVFMQIEYPESGPIVQARLASDETYPTIGAFYDAVLQGFQQLNPTFTGQHQIKKQIRADTVFPILNLNDVTNAINEIKEQGEGTSQSPEDSDPNAPGELAHYYRFAEIYHGATLVQVNGTWGYTGAPMPFPAVYPMAQVPAGGWTNQPNTPPQVQQLLNQFNTTFYQMLTDLQTAWTSDPRPIEPDPSDPASLETAIDEMFDLSATARQLMQIAIPGGGGNYGPDFQRPVSS